MKIAIIGLLILLYGCVSAGPSERSYCAWLHHKDKKSIMCDYEDTECYWVDPKDDILKRCEH